MALLALSGILTGGAADPVQFLPRGGCGCRRSPCLQYLNPTLANLAAPCCSFGNVLTPWHAIAFSHDLGGVGAVFGLSTIAIGIAGHGGGRGR